MSAPPRFKRLVIEEVFGPGSHTIDVSFRLSERVTVLHGKNGSGKTITLGLLAALREGQYSKFTQFPFKRFIVEMINNEKLIIESASGDAPDKAHKRARRKAPSTLNSAPMRYVLSGPEGERERGLLQLDEEKLDKESGFNLRDFGVVQVGHDEFRIAGVSESLTRSEIAEHLPSSMARRVLLQLEPDGGPKLRAFREALPPVKFIQTDRLFRWESETSDRYLGRPQMRRQLMVEHLGLQIRALVRQADEEYRKTSTRLDASLAERLFERQDDVPLEALKKRSEDLRNQETRLLKLGLLNQSNSSVEAAALTEAQRGTFSIILSDREEKLKPFAQVVDKAESLLDSLNKKLAPKQVKLNVESGYQILTAAGTPLPLSSLSSGEQHELVLLHELLFEVAPNSLILIDEPELSLHVTWQVDLLPDLMKIAELSGLDFVLATHSPFIIGDAPGRSGLMVRLGDPQ